MEEQIRKWLDNDYNLRNKYLKDYDQAPDKTKWWISHRGDLRNYTGYKTLNSKISTQPLKDRLVKSLDEEDWKEAPIAYKRDVAKELGTTVEKLDDAWNEHLEEVRKSNEIQARKDEVENWPWYKKAIASDYAKQRYINDPEASIFSDKGEWYNKGEDISDLLYGGAAAVGDFIPGVGGTVVGPAVRGMRDVQHKLYDSPYQKEWSDIAGDVGTDLMFNVGTDMLPTALLKRGSRVAKNTKNSVRGRIGEELHKADEYLQAKHNVENIKDGTEQFGNGDWMKQYDLASSPTKWDKAVDRLPDSPMKNDLKTLRDAPRNEKLDALTQWEVAAGGNPHPYIYVENNGEEVLKPFFKDEVRPAVTEHYKTVLKGSEGASDLTKTLAAGADAWKTFGERGVKEGKTIVGRGSKPKEQEQNKFDRWERGYATWDEKKSKEYKDWEDAHLKTILGLE